MAKVYQFMADGFEDIEALIPVDVLRRGGVDIQTVSITDSNIVESAHGVQMVTDLIFEEADLSDADLLMLPGGMPGASNLNEHEGLKKALVAQAVEFSAVSVPPATRVSKRNWRVLLIRATSGPSTGTSSPVKDLLLPSHTPTPCWRSW